MSNETPTVEELKGMNKGQLQAAALTLLEDYKKLEKKKDPEGQTVVEGIPEADYNILKNNYDLLVSQLKESEEEKTALEEDVKNLQESVKSALADNPNSPPAIASIPASNEGTLADLMGPDEDSIIVGLYEEANSAFDMAVNYLSNHPMSSRSLQGKIQEFRNNSHNLAREILKIRREFAGLIIDEEVEGTDDPTEDLPTEIPVAAAPEASNYTMVDPATGQPVQVSASALPASTRPKSEQES